jgi:hypothetical protein
MGRLAVRLALAVHCLFPYHRHSGPIHLDVENRNRLADDDGQIQLDGLLHFFLFTLSNVFSDRFRHALDRLGGHFQTSQDFHLFAAMVEGSILAHQGVRTAHPGRERRILYIQFHVGRELAMVAVSAQVVGTRNLHFADRRQNWLRA